MKTSTEHSLLSAFCSLRNREPERPLFTFVDERGRDEETITVAGLADSAEMIASSLRAWGFLPGDRAVLVYPPGPDFVRALLGCMAAGVVPVPVYPPNPMRLKQDLVGFNRIVESCKPQAVLTNSTYERARTVGAVTGLFDKTKPSWPRIRWHRTDKCRPAGGAFEWHEPAHADEPALLQYTSGSTAAPKGVIITHGNLSEEVRSNARDLELGDGTRGVFWVPQYHDLGLISCIISTIAGNSHTHLLSPLTFLQRPSVWFDVMSRVKATHTAAPNFAFELAVRKTTPAQRAAWDLSSLRVVMSAAEPIRPSTVDSFYRAFGPSGLQRYTFYPAYGLAEATVSVTMGGKRELTLDKHALQRGEVKIAPGGTRFMGCGRMTKPGGRVRIVDPETLLPCEPGRVGEVWVHAATTALGYYGLEAETRRVFHATLPGDDVEYLRTGDLGFLHEDELYITGRHKDVIIINGRNFYPEDIEDAVRDSHPEIRPGGLASFSVPGEDSEKLVIFVESKEKKPSDEHRADIADAVRQRLFATHQLVAEVVVGRQGLVLKTTSGKIRRRACRQAYLEGTAG
ncbi:fatty acyl-AMP ligase [Lentzea sp. NBRC 105346]|uniref:fatty acyl-AMP ligase n=1 Tax=Lentzea sp. NBRC 105346 TaxID=3032205 RepID=UPI0024A2E45E|nr:fatty acyl-AMP ligase [Lentzea sp. NBRC 105346]GLZ28828.1 fatty acyl-AMP ligase [Lentzea sp. NBRC 105346]